MWRWEVREEMWGDVSVELSWLFLFSWRFGLSCVPRICQFCLPMCGEMCMMFWAWLGGLISSLLMVSEGPSASKRSDCLSPLTHSLATSTLSAFPALWFVTRFYLRVRLMYVHSVLILMPQQRSRAPCWWFDEDWLEVGGWMIAGGDSASQCEEARREWEERFGLRAPLPPRLLVELSQPPPLPSRCLWGSWSLPSSLWMNANFHQWWSGPCNRKGNSTVCTKCT